MSEEFSHFRVSLPELIKTRKKLDVISGRSDVPGVSRPVVVDKLARIIEPFEGMRAEKVSLRLDDVGRQRGASVAVVEGEGGGKGRRGNAGLDRGPDDFSPRRMTTGQSGAEEIVHQQRRQVGFGREGFLDVSQKDASNDATSAPHQSDPAVIQIPFHLFGRFSHEHEALGVRHDLGRVKGVGELIHEDGSLVGSRESVRLGRTGEDGGGGDALVLIEEGNFV